MKNLKKFIGLLLIAILLVTSVGTSAEAAKWNNWPYGTYKRITNDKYMKNERLDFGFGTDGVGNYPDSIWIYFKDDLGSGEGYAFKRTKTVNKYKSKYYPLRGDSKKSRYFTLKVSGKKIILKEVYYGKVIDTTKYKLIKKLSKNIS